MEQIKEKNNKVEEKEVKPMTIKEEPVIRKEINMSNGEMATVQEVLKDCVIISCNGFRYKIRNKNYKVNQRIEFKL